ARQIIPELAGAPRLQPSNPIVNPAVAGVQRWLEGVEQSEFSDPMSPPTPPPQTVEEDEDFDSVSVAALKRLPQTIEELEAEREKGTITQEEYEAAVLDIVLKQSAAEAEAAAAAEAKEEAEIQAALQHTAEEYGIVGGSSSQMTAKMLLDEERRTTAGASGSAGVSFHAGQAGPAGSSSVMKEDDAVYVVGVGAVVSSSSRDKGNMQFSSRSDIPSTSEPERVSEQVAVSSASRPMHPSQAGITLPDAGGFDARAAAAARIIGMQRDRELQIEQKRRQASGSSSHSSMQPSGYVSPTTVYAPPIAVAGNEIANATSPQAYNSPVLPTSIPVIPNAALNSQAQSSNPYTPRPQQINQSTSMPTNVVLAPRRQGSTLSLLDIKRPDLAAAVAAGKPLSAEEAMMVRETLLERNELRQTSKSPTNAFDEPYGGRPLDGAVDPVPLARSTSLSFGSQAAPGGISTLRKYQQSNDAYGVASPPFNNQNEDLAAFSPPTQRPTSPGVSSLYHRSKAGSPTSGNLQTQSTRLSGPAQASGQIPATEYQLLRPNLTLPHTSLRDPYSASFVLDTTSSIDPILAFSLLSNHPVTVKKDELCPYFEVTILRADFEAASSLEHLDPAKREPIIAIGLATKANYREDRVPGWYPISVSYLSTGERAHCTSSVPEGMAAADSTASRSPFFNGFGARDTIGCGYIPSIGGVFFTMNGDFVGEAFSLLGDDAMDSDETSNRMSYPFHAAIGASFASIDIWINFGQRPFLYREANGGAGFADENASETISSHDMHAPSQNLQVANAKPSATPFINPHNAVLPTAGGGYENYVAQGDVGKGLPNFPNSAPGVAAPPATAQQSKPNGSLGWLRKRIKSSAERRAAAASAKAARSSTPLPSSQVKENSGPASFSMDNLFIGGGSGGSSRPSNFRGRGGNSETTATFSQANYNTGPSPSPSQPAPRQALDFVHPSESHIDQGLYAQSLMAHPGAIPQTRAPLPVPPQARTSSKLNPLATGPVLPNAGLQHTGTPLGPASGVPFVHATAPRPPGLDQQLDSRFISPAALGHPSMAGVSYARPVMPMAAPLNVTEIPNDFIDSHLRAAVSAGVAGPLAGGVSNVSNVRTTGIVLPSGAVSASAMAAGGSMFSSPMPGFGSSQVHGYAQPVVSATAPMAAAPPAAPEPQWAKNLPKLESMENEDDDDATNHQLPAIPQAHDPAMR
ncbi:hypothetical protein HDU96_000553, partial [Phlyctochytrium bullatum]